MKNEIEKLRDDIKEIKNILTPAKFLGVDMDAYTDWKSRLRLNIKHIKTTENKAIFEVKCNECGFDDIRICSPVSAYTSEEEMIMVIQNNSCKCIEEDIKEREELAKRLGHPLTSKAGF